MRRWIVLGTWGYLYQSIVESPKHFSSFRESVVNTRRLLEAKVDAADRQCFLRLLYVNVITALETYLCDNFISLVANNPKLLRRFVETNPEFKTEKIPLSDIFRVSEELEQKVRTYLVRIVWHRLERVKPMFRDTLGVDFPIEMAGLFKAVEVRHDLVHRSVRTEDGIEHVLDEEVIENLVRTTEQFVVWIECQQQSVGEIAALGPPPEF